MRYNRNTFNSVCFLVLMFCLSSCNLSDLFNECGADEEIGELEPDDVSNDFFYSEWKEKQVFRNEQGNEKTLFAEDISEEDQKTGKYLICTASGNREQYRFYTYKLQKVKFTFEDIEITQSLIIIDPSGYGNIPFPPLMDVFVIRGTIYENNISSMYITTSHRGNLEKFKYNQKIDNYDINDYDQYVYAQDTSILGQNFANVYGTIGDKSNDVLYTPDNGIVALRLSGRIWVVKE